MREYRKISAFILKISVLSLLTLFCILHTRDVSRAVSAALERCLAVIIPSLYAVMIVSELLSESNLISVAAKPFTLLGLHFSGSVRRLIFIFTLSLFAGYPVGARLLCSQYENGNISRKTAVMWSGVCYGAGPAFIYGCIASQLYGSSHAGAVILISTVSANIIIAVFLLMFTDSTQPDSSSATAPVLSLNTATFVNSVTNAGRAIVKICLMITAFSVFIEFLYRTGFICSAALYLARFSDYDAETLCVFLSSILDVTCVSSLSIHDNYTLLPFICALVSFGGVCVIMQISAVVSGKLSISKLVVMRIISALLSALVCKIITPLILGSVILPVSSADFSLYKAQSPVPSLMLLVMTFMLMEKQRNNLPKSDTADCDISRN